MNKWCPLMQIYCLKQLDYDEYSNYFGRLIMSYLKDFSKILPTQEKEQSTGREFEIRDFLNSMIIQELLRLTDQTSSKEHYGKNIMENATLFLNKQIDRTVQYRLYFLIPFTRDIYNRPLLERICTENAIFYQYECHYDHECHCDRIAAVNFLEKNLHI
jgi:hypothetical protein